MKKFLSNLIFGIGFIDLTFLIPEKAQDRLYMIPESDIPHAKRVAKRLDILLIQYNSEQIGEETLAQCVAVGSSTNLISFATEFNAESVTGKRSSQKEIIRYRK